MSHWVELVPMGTASFGNGWEGRVVEGRFPLLERLGGSENCGSFLTVLQGLQEAVIQLILPDSDEAESYVAQWDFARTLSHPHLARLFAEGRCVIDRNNLVYVVAERGSTTLSNIIQTRALKADSAREFFTPVLDALSYLHKNGVVHGYINPSNIQFADLNPKLPVTDLLIAGSAQRSFSGSGKYDAPELMHGNVTAAADTWSIGMCMFEAMTQIPPSREASRYEDPDVTKFVPGSFRGIVQDCLRVDPLRRCTIENILERLDESKSIPMSDSTSAVETDSPSGAATSVPTSETPILDKPDVFPFRAERVSGSTISDKPNAQPLEAETASETPILDKPDAPPAPAKRRSEAPILDKPDRLPFPAEKSEVEEFSEPALFSKSLTHFDESPLSRFRVVPYLFVLLTVIAVIAVLVARGHKGQTSSAVASQNALAVSPPIPKKESATPAPSVANQTEPEANPPVTETQPNSTSQAETPVAPSPKETVPSAQPPASQAQPPASPAQLPPSPTHHALVTKGNSQGLVATRVLPIVSPGARAGMRRPVEVVLRVTVNRDGTVADAAYVSPGPGNYFARLAQRTALSWKFKPPIRNGDPERSVWTLQFNFEREKTEATATEGEN
ncbi:MAG: TonB family protein [Terracidiphilus sp.]